MSEKQKKETIAFNTYVKYTGLILLAIMLLSHIFYKELELSILLIPAIMIGLDVTSFFKK